MNAKPPSPAIVSQAAVRALPRPILWMLCLVYVCAGFIGRHAWKNEDVTTYGYMQAVARGETGWLSPDLLGQPLEPAGHLLSVWLGALALWLRPEWLAPEFAVRLPFMALVLLSFAAVWYATYHLARRPEAQPVPFAFGGEARPTDYARALADGAVLALIACLGLIQFSHETTATVVQLFGACLLFLAFAMIERRAWLFALMLAALLLAHFAGGAVWFVLASLAACTAAWLCRDQPRATAPSAASGTPAATQARPWTSLPLLLLAPLALLALKFYQGGQWPLVLPFYDSGQWKSIIRLFIWFGWPAWLLACWALYRWRHHIFTRHPSYHLALPLALMAVTAVIAVCSEGSLRDRTLFLSLPMAATLAAFALPTMRRSVAALIDWFTLLFFTACGATIWVIWTATQTGVPAKPAANVAKLAPEYVPQFSLLAFALALLATAVWLAVIAWRTSHHQAALWKSLVLPAGGATWCVVLVMTLWLPMLDYGRSYVPQIAKLQPHIPSSEGCIWVVDLPRPQLAAFHAQANWPLRQAEKGIPRAADTASGGCTLAMVAAHALPRHAARLAQAGWREWQRVERPTGDETVVLFRPAMAPATAPRPVAPGR